MQNYRTALLVVHVLSAIIGIGATFTFGVLGSLQGRMPGPAAGALLEASDAIGDRLVRPFALVLLPLTGALMIFSRGWSTNFFSHEWLLAAIVLYVIAASLGTGVLEGGTKKLIKLGEHGKAGSPEFERLVRIQQRVGPLTSVLAVAIIVLMVAKPGN